MEYYLLSEQDIYEIRVEIENLLYEIMEVIKSKKIQEDERD
jgi:hypothetical protein